eukprot:scaffold3788_cov105-Pinguiococcus_pyrenoidosus.AAC.1
MILLSDYAVATKEGGQALVGGLDARVCRNYFGAQISSFEKVMSCRLDEEGKQVEGEDGQCSGVFIRAPAILKVGENVE